MHPSSSSKSSTPRSILKANTPEPPPLRTPVAVMAAQSAHCSVRFPSSPKLSTVHLTHCSTSYDRTPIIVLPNSCAMPERGCRSYSPGGTPTSPQAGVQAQWTGKHVHPSLLNRNAAAMDTMYTGSLLPPPLTSDEGSSEESDGVASPPPELNGLVAGQAPGHYRAYVPSQSHLYSEPMSHPPISEYTLGAATYVQYPSYMTASQPAVIDPSSFLPYAPPAGAMMQSRSKRDRPKGSSHRRETSASFSTSGSWGQNDESSCLGGF